MALLASKHFLQMFWKNQLECHRAVQYYRYYEVVMYKILQNYYIMIHKLKVVLHSYRMFKVSLCVRVCV